MSDTPQLPPVSPNIQLTQLDAQTAITALVAAGGNAQLAAAQLTTRENPVTPGLLLACIARDPASPTLLYAQLKMLMVLQAFDAFSKTHLAYLQQLSQLPPSQLAKTYTSLLNNFALLTGDAAASTPPNPIDALLNSLPPEVADAVELLIKAPRDDTPLPQPQPTRDGPVSTNTNIDTDWEVPRRA